MTRGSTKRHGFLQNMFPSSKAMGLTTIFWLVYGIWRSLARRVMWFHGYL